MNIKNPELAFKQPFKRNRQQRFHGSIQIFENVMALFSFARKNFVLCMIALAAPVAGYGNYVPQGGEYQIAGAQSGDQINPHASVKASGGYLVWQDNITDGAGLGISARKLDSSLSATLSTFRVNQTGAADQERPQISLLNGGGAAFVWQGGPQGLQHIYARLLSSGGTWLTADVQVNTATNVYQIEPVVATLTNGNVVVVWSSFNQVSGTSMRDLYAQILTPTGTKYGSESLLNQTTAFNQRSAAVAALTDGRFVVVWVSEHQRFENSVDIYGRIYNASGTPAAGEFRVSAGTNVCANPTVSASVDGGFAVTWMERDLIILANGWDIFSRPFAANAAGGVTRRINTYTVGDQVGPKISSLGSDNLVAWTSVGQDGSREGVYAQYLQADGSLAGSEFRLNTATVSQQMYPTVASDGVERFVTVWSGFVGGASSFDLFAQRYANTNQPLNAPAAPVVSVLDSVTLALTWQAVLGLDIANYEVYADGAATPTTSLTNTHWNMTGLSAGSSHSFRLAYVLADGRRSPLSAPANATTYQYPFSYGGIAYDWMIQMWGSEIGNWPSATADGDLDGASNLQEFLQGTNPKDANSVLRYKVRQTEQGLFLDWNTQPGLMYQVQSAPAAGAAWINLGGPRFAAGTSDSIYVGGGSTGFYRIGRIR